MFGFVLAVTVFPDVIYLEAAILAVILAPTDADLARPITSNEGLTEKVILGVEIECGLYDSDDISAPDATADTVQAAPIVSAL
ncbi:MAG: hypothetical protein ACN2B6_12810 [Rickettsiales bacterium]